MKNDRATANNDVDKKDVAFKNNAPSRSCITKINSTLIDNAEDPDIVMPMHFLLEYNQNHSMTSGSLLNYYRDLIDVAYDNASDGKSFKQKTKVIGKTEERPGRPGSDDDGNPRPQSSIPPLNTEVVVPLKYLSNWRSLNLALINCEIELDLKWTKNCIKLDLKWTKNCVLIKEDNHVTGVSFTISSSKLYVPVVTLSVNDNTKFLENIKQKFKRAISWNKHRSEITAQTKTNILDYLIDPIFRNINTLFVLSFKNGNNDPAINLFYRNYMPLVEIKMY